MTPPSGGSGFGRSARRWEKKIFAMLVRGRLVVKHPAARVDVLVDIVTEGGSQVVATHDPEVAEKCDRVLDLRASA